MAKATTNTDNMPEIPAERYTIKQIREMDSFSGVYIAFSGDDIIYIGESKDVTERVTKSRSELKGCTSMAVIECPVEHRKRLEAYLIGKHNPLRNHEHPERQKESLTKQGWEFSSKEDGGDGVVIFTYPEMYKIIKRQDAKAKKEECQVFYQDGEVYIPAIWVGLTGFQALAALSYDGMSMNTRNETAYIPIKWAIKEYSPYKKREKLVENLQHVKSTILEQIQNPEEQDPESPIPYWEPSSTNGGE